MSLENTKKPSSPIWNIVFNIALPIFILNKLSSHIGSVNAVVLALCFPLFYGGWEHLKNKKINFISILGIIHVLITGGFALSGLTGHWFTLKEAAFPALVGLFVIGSSYTKKPFMETLIINPQVMNISLVTEKVLFHQKEESYNKLVKLCTQLMAASFFLSAILNYFLADRIFTPILETLNQEEKMQILNQQIAEMTKYSMFVILIPTMIFSTGIVLYLFKKLEAITGLKMEDMMPSTSKTN